MNLLRSFLIVLIFTFSLHAATYTDVVKAFSSCPSVPGADENSSKIIDINSTNACHLLRGSVNNGSSTEVDVYIFKIQEDLNISYVIFNKSSPAGKNLQYSINSGNCSAALTNVDGGADSNGTMPQFTGPYPKYIYFYIENKDDNADVEYDLTIGIDGICSGGGGGIINPALHTANIDIVDGYNYTDPNYTSWIKTKTSNKNGYVLNAVYLGTGEGTPLVPQAYEGGSGGSTASVTLLLKLADFSSPATTCQNATPINLYTTAGGNTPVVAIIDDGETTDVTNSFSMAYAPSNIPLSKQNVRFMYKSVDFNQLIIDSGIVCAQKSSTGGVVEGIPACLIAQPNDTTENKNKALQNYTTIFGQTAYTSCYTENGEPCAASSGGWGTPPYDHEYGCFECSIGNMPYVCSNDNFAIRPNQFAINNSTDSDFPNLLRSAEDYNLTVYAYDYGVTSGTNGSKDYNITSAASIFELNPTKYFKSGTIATDVQMHGTPNWSAYDFNMSNGVSWSTASVGSEVAGVQFDDVGKINLQVIDKVWSAVDIDNLNDPTPEDCTAEGAWICGDTNVTYIPEHFDFHDLNITNNNGNPGTFTYIANEVNQMAGRIHTQIRALNKVGNVTQNFAEFPLWENNVTVVPVVTTSKYIYTDANETNITNLLIGFGGTGDANGTKTIPWNEPNTSQHLRFNFQRDVNLSVNPFDVNGSDLNINITSHYVDSADGDTADINGSRLGTVQPADGNSTFLYGRTHASRQRYDCGISPCSGDANIYFESYCFGAGCDKTLLNGFSPNLQRTDDLRWYINEAHAVPDDGSVGTVSEKVSTVHVTATAPIININPIRQTTTLTYTGNRGYPYKTTMHNDASPWLIYNESDPTATRNEFQVEFDNIGTWTGEHETNTTTKTPAGATTNRRIMW